MALRMNSGVRRATRVVLPALAAGALALAGTSALATTASASTNDIGANCFITQDNVNYRSGPGIQYASYGQVNKGQGFYTYAYSGRWLHGDLWGGRKDVWISADYCST